MILILWPKSCWHILKFTDMPLCIVRVVACIEKCNVGVSEAEVMSTCGLYRCVLCWKVLFK
jgi:hypothetical protein